MDFPASIVTLDNGLTVIHQHVPVTPVVVVDVWVRAGAAIEPEPWSGMAHFLEHMIFKGSDRLAPGWFDLEIENRGGVANAATSHDYAHFFITTAAEHFADTLPHLAEILLRAAIEDEEFARERLVVLEEIRQADDHPDGLAFQALMETAYQQHPYGRPVLGTEASLMRHTPEEMRCFHQSHYQPENMTVAVVGNVSREFAVEQIARTFSEFAPPPACPLSLADAEPPMTEVRRRELYFPHVELARLNLAWTGPGVEQVREAYGLDLLSVLLAEGRSSRLVRELREQKHWVQEIGSGFSLQRDSSLFTISAWLESQWIEPVEAFISDRLMELQEIPVSEAELDRAKRLLCNDYAFSTETPIQLAGLYGYYQTIANAKLAVAYPHHIQSYRPEELQLLANRYLRGDRYAATVVQPV